MNIQKQLLVKKLQSMEEDFTFFNFNIISAKILFKTGGNEESKDIPKSPPSNAWFQQQITLHIQPKMNICIKIVQSIRITSRKSSDKQLFYVILELQNHALKGRSLFKDHSCSSNWCFDATGPTQNIFTFNKAVRYTPLSAHSRQYHDYFQWLAICSHYHTFNWAFRDTFQNLVYSFPYLL